MKTYDPGACVVTAGFSGMAPLFISIGGFNRISTTKSVIYGKTRGKGCLE